MGMVENPIDFLAYVKIKSDMHDLAILHWG